MNATANVATSINRIMEEVVVVATEAGVMVIVKAPQTLQDVANLHVTPLSTRITQMLHKKLKSWQHQIRTT